MAVSVLTAPLILSDQVAPTTNATVPTIAAGNDRFVEICIAMYNGGGTSSPPTAVTANGQTAPLIIGDSVARDKVATGSYYFLESQIAAISGQALVSNDGTGSQKSVSITVFQDAKQAAPTNKVAAWGDTGTLTLPLTRATGSMTVARGYNRFSGTALTFANPVRTGTINYTSRWVTYSNFADSSGTSDFTTNAGGSTSAHVYNIEPAAALKEINSTNSGANDLNAGAVNTASVTGYVVGVNPVVSGTVGSLALTSVSQATIISTFTIPAPINDSYYPQPDTSHILTLTDGSNPATFNAVMNSLAGYTSIVLASPDLADTHKIPYWLTSTAVNDDRIMYKTADMTVSADGGISGATLGVTTIYYHWRVADSKIYAYEALLDEEGVVVSTPKPYFIGVGIGVGFGI